MRLHLDPEAFRYAVGVATEELGFRQFFLEKDYWITVMLRQIASSEFRDRVVFKGGTSLSKGYNIIERISEDVDIAVVDPLSLGDSAKKKIIKRIEKSATLGLTPRPDPTEVKRGMRRTTLHGFPPIIGHPGGGPDAEWLKLEITAYSRTAPSEYLPIQSYIGQALEKTGRPDLIEEFDLGPFEIQVLGLEWTFAEKVMALIKLSHGDDWSQRLQEKVRHVYDLQQMLTKRQEMQVFLKGDAFFELLGLVANDDARNHTSDLKWLDCDYGSCALFGDPERAWRTIEPAYRTGFRSLLFGELPSSERIMDALGIIGERLREYDRARPRA